MSVKENKLKEKGNYPVTVIAIRDGKVVRKETVDTPMQVPDVFNIVRFEEFGKGGDVKVYIEDRNGETIKESTRVRDRTSGIQRVRYGSIRPSIIICRNNGKKATR